MGSERTRSLPILLLNLPARKVANDLSCRKTFSAAYEFDQAMLLLPRHKHKVLSTKTTHIFFVIDPS
jgi:hypothetical protein